MRAACLLIVLVLPGCLPGCGAAPLGALAAVELASTTVFGRGVIDIGVSAMTGRDCSLVRLDRGKTYCGPPEATAPETACTRTLAAVDCWVVPPRGAALVGDTPGPSRAQAQHRAAPWPKAVTTAP